MQEKKFPKKKKNREHQQQGSRNLSLVANLIQWKNWMEKAAILMLMN